MPHREWPGVGHWFRLLFFSHDEAKESEILGTMGIFSGHGVACSSLPMIPRPVDSAPKINGTCFGFFLLLFLLAILKKIGRVESGRVLPHFIATRYHGARTPAGTEDNGGIAGDCGFLGWYRFPRQRIIVKRKTQYNVPT